MHIQLGDTVLETIQITTNRKTMDPIWYEDFNQKLISLGYKEIRHCAWEGAFIFDREERFSIRTPGERALKKILKAVGMRSLIISLKLGSYPEYQLETRDILAPYNITHPTYIKRFTLSLSIKLPPQKLKIKPIDHNEVAQLYHEGWEIVDIAKQLKTTKTRIYDILNEDILKF